MATAPSGVVRIGGDDVPYSVRYSRKASRLSLRLSPVSGLEVVVPAYAGRADVHALVVGKKAWIARKLDDFARRERMAPRVQCRDGARIAVLGRDYTLRIKTTSAIRSSVTVAGDEIILAVPVSDPDRSHEFLERWLLRVAKTEIPRRVGELNAIPRHAYSSVSIRSQKTRWGSCSRRGTLSFNWRLVLLPPFVMDYLIYHELAHLKVMNHSPRFWRVVTALCPEFDAAERWLKESGPFVLP